MKFESLIPCGTRRKPPLFGRSSSLGTIASLLTLATLAPLSNAQNPVQAPVGFSYSRVNGLKVGSNNKASKVTSLQFGPDNKLYYLQSNGTVWYCTVNRIAKDNYEATGLTPIELVKEMPNYNDDGTYNPAPMPNGQNYRQATGLLVTGTAANPVIYVTSSDPREGAGSGATDLNLDTNSGVVSRLTKNGSGVWEKVDIVRGLPRSEENHATNGLAFDPTGTKLLVCQGGSTNAGAPSNNFAFACEQALAASVLSVDLAAIEAMPVQTDSHGQKYLYNLPTVNDPSATRADVPGNPGYADQNDPFGGNDGLNQARIVEGGPVQIFASGFRNPYDVMVAKTPGRVGKVYTFDNAANSGWGGYPKNEALPTVTNEWVSGEPGTVNNHDSLQLISQGYYGGHPNPIRANPSGAGWLHFDNGGAGLVYSASPTVDWPPVPPSMADSRQSDFKLPGAANLALWTNTASTCGLAEYSASNFGGAMVGNIITAQFSQGAVQRIVMNADGTQALSSSIILGASGYGSPLDIAIPGPGAAPALTGTIFVAHYLSSDPGVTVLEPTDFDSVGAPCTGDNSYALDEDNDGYSNADEILNASDPCSPAVRPKDFDSDFLSDMLDTDDDNDGISDSQDAYPIDALNGASVGLPLEYHLFNTIHGFFSIGFTGVMLEPGVDYTQRINDAEIIAGGTAGLYTDPSMGPGTALGAANSQMNAFQFGVNVDQTTAPFRVIAGLGGLLFNGTPTDLQSQGIFIGNGDQDNYVKVAVNANGGPGAIEVVHEENGVVLANTLYPQPNLFTDTVQLSFLVNPLAGTVQPGYALGSGAFINVGPLLTVGGKIRDVLHGSGGMAVGLIGTTGNASTPTFNATWDYFKVLPVNNTASASLMINSNAGSILSSSTNTGGSFKLTNTSTGGQKIVSATIDISTAALPDVVFDPNHTAGDSDGTGYVVESFSGSGTTPVGVMEGFHNGVNSQEGYNVLRVTADPNANSNFGPGAILSFSADIDPTSIKGNVGPGPNQAGSVNGLELTGTTVTVTFDDGTVRQIRTAGQAASGFTQSNKTSYGVLEQDKLTTPVISVPGKSSPYVANTQPTVRVAGPAGSSVKLWILHTSFDTDAVIPPYDVDPFEANNVTSYDIDDASIGVSGYVDVPITLSSDTGGINYVIAVLVDLNNANKRSSASNILVIDYDPNASDDAKVRVNAGGPSFTDSLGHTWDADKGFTSGSTQSYANPIAGTEDDALYQTFRYDDSPSTPLDYSFQLPNGNYQVKLHFAETWSGITAPGMRVFDVELEGQTVLDNYDVYAVAGPNTARVETFQAAVTDGNLTIGLRKVTQNPFINAIEVYYLGGGSGPDVDPPTAPGSLAASNLKSGSLTLTWTAATDNTAVTGYRVFREGSDLGTTTSLSFPQPGLTPQTEYDYEVEAFDAAGNLSARATLTVTTPADTESPTTPGNFKGVAGNQTATLSWLPATDDTAVTGYRVYRDNVLLTTVTTLGYSEGGLTNGTNYTYQVEAIDATGKASPRGTVIVRPRAIAGVVYRIDCGLATGTSTDSLGNVWVADTYHNGAGIVDSSSQQIAGTNDDVIYRTRRYDTSSGAELKYTLPVPNGDYELRLHFAETTSAFQSPTGQRVFDVKVQNQLAIDNLDIVASAGYATALVIPVPVTVTNGNATVEFLHTGLNNPVIAGIELYELEPPPPDTMAPTQPGSFAVTGTTAGSVSLAWTASVDNVEVIGYKISRNGGAPVTVTGLSYTDTGLAPGTVYNYTVLAVDAAQNASSAAATQGTTQPDINPPSAPVNLLASAGNASAGLSWQASTDDVAVTAYRIYKDNVLIDTVATLNYIAAGLTNETAYAFKVTAIDAFNNESSPALVSVTPRALGSAIYRVDCGKTDAGYSYTDPSGNVWARDDYFNANNTSISTVTNNITGTTNPEIYKSFHFKVRTSSTPLKYEFPVTNGNYEVRLHFAETSSSGNVAGYRKFNVLLEGATVIPNLDVFVEAGGQYKALVKVLPAAITDGKITLDFTNANPVTQNPFVCGIEIFPILSGAAGETEPPSTPGNLLTSNLTGNSVSLNWTASTDNVGVTGYRIYRNSALIDTVTTLTYNSTGLTPGTLYHYEVRAIDAASNVSAPAAVDVTTLNPDTQAPTTPGNLGATPAINQIALVWTTSTDNIGVTGYKVYRGGNFLTTVTSLGFTDTGLASGTQYSYEVLAVDAAGNTSTAAAISSTTLTDTQAPSIPGSLGGTPSFTSVELTWQASTDNIGVTGYRVYRGATLVTTVTTLGFTDGELTPGTNYHYEVRAIDAAGNASNAATLDTTTVVDSQAPTAPPGFYATAGDQSVALSWAAAFDNVGVVNYEIRRNSVVIATTPTRSYTDSGLTNGMLYTYQVRAIDAANNVSAPSSDSAKPRAIGANLYRVDAGNITEPYVDAGGNTWAIDTPYFVSGSSPSSSGNSIAGTLDDSIYQTYRIDSAPTGAKLAYNFPVAPGEYEVRLHFVETHAPASVIGGRIFDVRAEGNVTIDDLDIFARAGANTALVVSFPVTITDGTLNLDFVHGVVQNPTVSGIEIFPILPAGGPMTFEQWLTAHGLTGQTNADSDGGGLSNLEEFELQMDPNDPHDDFQWVLKVSKPSMALPSLVTLPELKPIGNYYLHRSEDPATLNQIGNRIDTITKAEIEAMTPAERANYTVQDNGAGVKAFYRLFFEPVAE